MTVNRILETDEMRDEKFPSRPSFYRLNSTIFSHQFLIVDDRWTDLGKRLERESPKKKLSKPVASQSIASILCVPLFFIPLSNIHER